MCYFISTNRLCQALNRSKKARFHRTGPFSFLLPASSAEAAATETATATAGTSAKAAAASAAETAAAKTTGAAVEAAAGTGRAAGRTVASAATGRLIPSAAHGRPGASAVRRSGLSGRTGPHMPSPENGIVHRPHHAHRRAHNIPPPVAVVPHPIQQQDSVSTNRDMTISSTTPPIDTPPVLAEVGVLAVQPISLLL